MNAPAVRPAILGLVLSLLALGLWPASASADPPSAASQEADHAAQRAESAGRRLLGLLGERRAIGDAARARCLDTALTQVNAFSRVILQRRARIREAEAQGAAARVRHERQVIARLTSQLRALEHEGQACVVPSHQSDGRTVVEMTVDPRVPQHADLSP